jgi:hypothetical protein
MEQLFKSKSYYQDLIFTGIKEGVVSAPLLFSIETGNDSWDEKIYQELSLRLWHSNYSMQFSPEGYVWYSKIQPGYTIISDLFSNAGAIIGIVRVFPDTPFLLDRNKLHHWDVDKQNAWALCGSNFTQWLSFLS